MVSGSILRLNGSLVNTDSKRFMVYPVVKTAKPGI